MLTVKKLIEQLQEYDLNAEVQIYVLDAGRKIFGTDLRILHSNTEFPSFTSKANATNLYLLPAQMPLGE
jgi:hypothetical protein